MTRHFLLIHFLLLALAGSLVFFVPIVNAQTAGQNPTGTAAPLNPSAVGNEFKSNDYFKYLYNYLLAFVGIAALFGIVFGGVRYMYAGANIGSTQRAYEWIQNAFLGIIVAAGAFLLLWIINPDFLSTGFSIEDIVEQSGFISGPGSEPGSTPLIPPCKQQCGPPGGAF